jgi:hypothetical protein
MYFQARLAPPHRTGMIQRSAMRPSASGRPSRAWLRNCKTRGLGYRSQRRALDYWLPSECARSLATFRLPVSNTPHDSIAAYQLSILWQRRHGNYYRLDPQPCCAVIASAAAATGCQQRARSAKLLDAPGGLHLSPARRLGGWAPAGGLRQKGSPTAFADRRCQNWGRLRRQAASFSVIGLRKCDASGARPCASFHLAASSELSLLSLP